jgi:hypothetical protein
VEPRPRRPTGKLLRPGIGARFPGTGLGGGSPLAVLPPLGAELLAPGEPAGGAGEPALGDPAVEPGLDEPAVGGLPGSGAASALWSPDVAETSDSAAGFLERPRV